MDRHTISPHELSERQATDPGLLLVDVRTPAEFEEVRAAGARLMPLDRLDAQAVRSAMKGNGPAYCLCRTGARAAQAAAKLRSAGVDAVVVEGGTLAWESAGLPVKRGRKTISLERQVRIGAGVLVVVGVLLGAFVHPAWLILSGFVGCGLIFAGVTGICGMAFILGKMPWNQAFVDPADMLCPTPLPAARGSQASPAPASRF